MQDNSPVKAVSAAEFSIAHYTGRVVYNAKQMPGKNMDFLPPEVIEVLCSSSNPIIKSLFINKLDKLGTLSVSMDENAPITAKRNISSSSSSEEDKVQE